MLLVAVIATFILEPDGQGNMGCQETQAIRNHGILL
jgi:hypothetical protein